MELLLLLLSGEELRPELFGKDERIGLNAVPGEIAAEIVDVALQKGKRVRVVPRVDRLREVDDPQFSLPVEDIERRQVAVDAVRVQHQLHITHKLPEKRLRLRWFKVDSIKHRSWRFLVSYVFHEDGAAGLSKGFGNVGSGPVEYIQGLELAVDPGVELNVATVSRLLFQGALGPFIPYESASLIDRVVPEAPVNEWAVDFGDEELTPGGWVGPAAVDCGFLAALDYV